MLKSRAKQPLGDLIELYLTDSHIPAGSSSASLIWRKGL